MAELHKYTVKGTVTYKFSDWILAESEREAMDKISLPSNMMDDTVVDLEHPDVYFEEIALFFSVRFYPFSKLHKRHSFH